MGGEEREGGGMRRMRRRRRGRNERWGDFSNLSSAHSKERCTIVSWVNYLLIKGIHGLKTQKAQSYRKS